MKKLLATVCILGLAATLSACTSKGEGYKDQAPYASERTVGSQQQSGQKAEQVFHSRQVK